MKTMLQVFSWIAIVLGALAFLGNDGDPYAVIGGVLFFTQGLLAICYINESEKKLSKIKGRK